jgi:transposase
MRVDQRISKAGNPRAHSLAFEIAWLWVRPQCQGAHPTHREPGIGADAMNAEHDIVTGPP